MEDLVNNNTPQNNNNDNNNNNNNNNQNKEEKMGLFKRSKNFVKRNKNELIMIGLAILGATGGAIAENKFHVVEKIKPNRNDSIKRK